MSAEPLAQEPLEYLSHSRLDTFRQCSLKFRFRYIDRLKPAFTPAPLAFGAAFHRAVEEALVGMMGGEMPPVEDLIKVFAKDLDEHEKEAPIRYGERESKESMIELATRMLRAWVAWPRPATKIVAVEHDFKIEMPGASWLPPLVGRIDLVEIDDVAGFVNVIDVKTSRGRWSAENVLEHSGQLELYRLAVEPLVKEVGLPVRMGFEVITKTKMPTIERHYVTEVLEPAEKQVRVATVVLEAIEKKIFIPSPSWACASCPFREPCRRW